MADEPSKDAKHISKEIGGAIALLTLVLGGCTWWVTDTLTKGFNSQAAATRAVATAIKEKRLPDPSWQTGRVATELEELTEAEEELTTLLRDAFTGNDTYGSSRFRRLDDLIAALEDAGQRCEP